MNKDHLEGLFKLTDSEFKKAETFKEDHQHKEINKGAIGGHIEYRFSPNGIFRALSIKCLICNKELNITDYSVW